MTSDEEALATLSWFVFRARRIAEHSLVVDRDRLVEWAQGKMEIVFVDDRPRTLKKRLPDEEAFESLAGRIRPFLMPRDQIYFKHVLAALRPYLGEDPGLRESLDELERRWSRFDPKSGQTLGYAMQIGKADELFHALVADTTLADAWLYCDFGHGDTNVTERVGRHSLDARYEAAVLLVSNVARCALSALGLVQQAWKAGLLPLTESDFKDRVLARTELSYELAGLAMAPVGTPMDQLVESLGLSAHGECQPDLRESDREQ